MGSTTNVNMKTVVHADSGGMAIAFPDVCKTPTPAGPVPIPYPNIALSKDASKVTKKVKVDKKGVMVKGSKIAVSQGDEAGTAGGGVVSSKIKGTAEFMNYSFDVKFEGKTVARLTDPMMQNQGSQGNTATPAEVQGPKVVIDFDKVGKTQEEACDKMKKKEVKDDKKGAKAAGMLEEDYKAIKEVCGDKGVLASFRDTNPDCLKHLKGGVPSKGHDILQKTWKSANLPADKKDMAGLVSNRLRKPAPGQIIDNPKLHPLGKVTGDYDMHEILKGGKKVTGAQEKSLIKSFNKAIPPSGNPPVQQPRVLHGAQANYSDYLAKNPGEKPIKALFKPDPPTTVFDGSKPPAPPAKVYRCETNEDILNMYKCKGAETPPEWNLKPKKK
ncbi:MAG: DUF4150 domain-containing protein [Deltaproteobacteria bacterium]|nr:DUF4150 domain-containing protein [Deltaproteobacteria bacterium]